jgi:hypothetical protein
MGPPINPVRFKANRGRDNLSEAITRGHYGECLTALGHYEDAEKQLAESFVHMTKLGTSHPYRQLAVRRLAELYRRLGNTRQETRYREMLAKASTASR